MANTLQEGLTEFRDLMYSSDPTSLKSLNDFSFNRNEFIFSLIDKRTKVVAKSKTKISLRVGKEDLMNFTDNAGTWELLKFDNTVLLDTDDEMVWLKSILDTIIASISMITIIDPKVAEYTSLLDRINSSQV